MLLSPSDCKAVSLQLARADRCFPSAVWNAALRLIPAQSHSVSASLTAAFSRFSIATQSANMEVSSITQTAGFRAPVSYIMEALTNDKQVSSRSKQQDDHDSWTIRTELRRCGRAH